MSLSQFKSPVFISVTTFLIALCIGGTGIGLAERARVAERQQFAAVTAATQASRIKEQIERSLSAAYSLAALVRQGNGRIAKFEEIAQEMLPLFPGVSALQLAPGGVIRQVVPLTNHERTLGHDLFADPARDKEALIALRTRQLTLAGPFDLIQGGSGMIGRLPVFLDDSSGSSQVFWGFVTVLMMTDSLIKSTAIDDLEQAGFRYELSRLNPDSNVRQVFYRNSKVPLKTPLAVNIDVPNGEWALHVEPQSGSWQQPNMLAAELILVLLVGLAAAVAAYQTARIPGELALLVERRTREAEEANVRLAHSEARFRDITETSSDWIWEVDTNGIYTYASPKVRDLLGYEPAEVIGRSPFDFMPAAEAARVGSLFQSIAAERRAFALLKNINLHKDGHKVVLETSAIPLSSDEGKFTGYRGIDRDITARHNAEEGLRKLSLAVEQSVNGIMITDTTGVIEFVNQKFCQMLGLNAGEIIGHELRSLEGELRQPEAYARMLQSVDAGEPWFCDYHHQGPDETQIWGIQTVSGIRNDMGELANLVVTIEDISNRKQLEFKLDRFAYYDQLTELPNRTLFLDRLGQAAALAWRENKTMALMMLDIDRLKNVNDSVGHHIGDELIKNVALRLRNTLRKEDSICRMEGDEFAALIIGVDDADDVARIVEKLRDVLNAPYYVGENEFHITTSIGISLFPSDAVDIDSLERNADTALHRAKKFGDCFRFFRLEMNDAVSRFLAIENKLRVAIERSQFLLLYQPQFDMDTGRIEAVEALIRWQDPESGLLMPSQFIALAEETGLIIPIGDWVLLEACRQAVKWRDAGKTCRVAVNLSALQFRHGHILDSVTAALRSTGATADLLEFEITEGMVMGRGNELESLNKLAAMGFRIAIDDFGTGYSSLAYLKDMPVHVLKIDGVFVRDLATSPDDRAIISAVVTLGHAMGLTVLAERVETRQQFDLLKALHCDLIQGYLCSPPLSADEMSDVLSEKRLLVLE